MTNVLKLLSPLSKGLTGKLRSTRVEPGWYVTCVDLELERGHAYRNVKLRFGCCGARGSFCPSGFERCVGSRPFYGSDFLVWHSRGSWTSKQPPYTTREYPAGKWFIHHEIFWDGGVVVIENHGETDVVSATIEIWEVARR